jgi:hypothetical protein
VIGYEAAGEPSRSRRSALSDFSGRLAVSRAAFGASLLAKRFAVRARRSFPAREPTDEGGGG